MGQLLGRVDVKVLAGAVVNLGAEFFDVPLEVCLERNRNRLRQVPEDVMQKMAANLEPPTLEEGFTRIVRVRKDGKVFEDVYSSLAGS